MKPKKYNIHFNEVETMEHQILRLTWALFVHETEIWWFFSFHYQNINSIHKSLNEIKVCVSFQLSSIYWIFWKSKTLSKIISVRICFTTSSIRERKIEKTVGKIEKLSRIKWRVKSIDEKLCKLSGVNDFWKLKVRKMWVYWQLIEWISPLVKHPSARAAVLSTVFFHRRCCCWLHRVPKWGQFINNLLKRGSMLNAS